MIVSTNETTIKPLKNNIEKDKVNIMINSSDQWSAKYKRGEMLHPTQRF